jgi:hypothetical protein
MVEGLGGDLRDVGVLGVAAEVIPRGGQEGAVLQTLDRGQGAGSTNGTLGTRLPKPLESQQHERVSRCPRGLDM